MNADKFRSDFPAYFLTATPLIQAILIGRLKMLKWGIKKNELLELTSDFINITALSSKDLHFTPKDFQTSVSQIESHFKVKYLTSNAIIPKEIVLTYIQTVQCHPKSDLINDKFFPGGRSFASDLQTNVEKLISKWLFCSPEYLFSAEQLEYTFGSYSRTERVRVYRDLLIHFVPIPEWLNVLAFDKRKYLVDYISLKSIDLSEVNNSMIDTIETLCKGHEKDLGKLKGIYSLGQYFFHQGRLDAVKATLPMQLAHHEQMTKAALTWMEGDFNAALVAFQDGMKMWQKIEKSKFNPLNDTYGLLYAFGQVCDSKTTGLKDLIAQFTHKDGNLLNLKNQERELYSLIKGVNAALVTVLKSGDPFLIVFSIWLSKYFKPDYSNPDLSELLIKYYTYFLNHSPWLAAEIDCFFKICAFGMKDPSKDSHIQLLPLPDRDFGRQEWEIWINKLEELNSDNTNNQDTRVIWIIEPDYEEVYPLEQKRMKNGDWSKGKKISIGSIYNNSYVLKNPQDRNLSGFIENKYYGSYDYEYEPTVAGLVNRDDVFLKDKTLIPVKIIHAIPTLQVTLNKKGSYILSIDPEIEGDITIFWRQFDLIEVYRYSLTHRRIDSILQEANLEFPPPSHPRLIKWLDSIKKDIHLSGDIPGELLEAIDTIDGSSKIKIKIIPTHDSTFRAETYIQPLDHLDYTFAIGEGNQNFIAELDGRLVNIRRDIKQETKNLKRVHALYSEPNVSCFFDEYCYVLEDQISMLTFLELCQPLIEEGVIHIEVLRDHNNKILSFLKPQQLFLHLNSSRGWLELEGEDIEVSEGLIVKFRDLLEFSQQEQTHFMEVGAGDFILISRKLKQMLKQIGSVAGWKNEEAIAHPLTALYLESVVNSGEAQVKKSKKWNDQVKKMESIEASKISLPKGLQATLRTYQIEGFEWLAKRGEQNLGACLADDMGLGKTIQSIAVLLHRASLGPALIIAPTSVCSNWMAEIERFAPELKTYNYYEEDRTALVEKLKAYDVLICSYGLVTNNIETLKSIQFSSAILDEAQAIKNSEAKRSKAVYQLDAKAKWVTTGTPIENRLQELWSIFRFINPGLLGTISQFKERFVTPIEGNKDELVSKNLRTIIQPFLLRRTKEEVLKDLPPKTEVDRTVILNQAEISFYETIRKKAKEDLASAGNLPTGQRQIKLFSILTQLRLASCHPSLVHPEIDMPGSKIEALHELLDEILPGGHQVLVFSQFVKHLALVKASLDQKKIPYFYLDGSTSPKERTKIIQAFESGERAVFLLSLKAGGTGINLTAASYVIHMDPWWNPAVEDQATDRAHRIGQDKPVTVYRLISKHTIEEKIRTIHQTKRDLADQIIGDQASSNLQLSEVMELLIG